LPAQPTVRVAWAAAGLELAVRAAGIEDRQRGGGQADAVGDGEGRILAGDIRDFPVLVEEQTLAVHPKLSLNLGVGVEGVHQRPIARGPLADLIGLQARAAEGHIPVAAVPSLDAAPEVGRHGLTVIAPDHGLAGRLLNLGNPALGRQVPLGRDRQGRVKLQGVGGPLTRALE